MTTMDDERKRANRRMALILASVAVVLFVGFIAKTYLLAR
jgi:hypothetical protein